MMDWTDRHCRYFLRGFSPHVLLYTEMITAAAILRGDRSRLLAFDPREHPLALQLGGTEPHDLAAAARIGEEAGYDEINLNCGCPSDRVASGAFGACLMLEPALVAECVAAMTRRGARPGHGEDARRCGEREARARCTGGGAGLRSVTMSALVHFVASVRAAGCQVAIVHARKAVLGGLSPKDNREIPPLRYEVVRRLRVEFPTLPLVGQRRTARAGAVQEALQWCDGVMFGREAYHRPYLLAELQQPCTRRRRRTVPRGTA